MKLILLLAITLLCACGSSGSGTGAETATYDNLAAIDFDNMTQEEKDKAAYEIFENFCDTCKAQSLVDFLDALDLEVQERNNMPGQTERFDRNKTIQDTVIINADSDWCTVNVSFLIMASQKLYFAYNEGIIHAISVSFMWNKSSMEKECSYAISFRKDGDYNGVLKELSGLELFDIYGRPIRTHLKK